MMDVEKLHWIINFELTYLKFTSSPKNSVDFPYENAYDCCAEMNKVTKQVRVCVQNIVVAVVLPFKANVG